MGMSIIFFLLKEGVMDMDTRDRNRLNNALKGVAYAGVAIGGASVVQSSDVIYAAELEQNDNDEIVLQLEEETTGSELAMSEKASESLSDMFSTDASLSESAAAFSESESASASDSASVGNSEYASSSEAASELGSLYDSTSMAYDEKYDSYLEELLEQIIKAQADVDAAKQEAIDNNEEVNHDPDSNNFYGYADTLTNLLIKYKLYQNGVTGDIQFSVWESDGYDNNYVMVNYTDKYGNERTEYFDYVTVDKDGNRLSLEDNDNPEKIDHIMVVSKTVKYTSGEDILTFSIAEDGTVTYYLNGEIIDSSRVTCNENGEYTIVTEKPVFVDIKNGRVKADSAMHGDYKFEVDKIGKEFFIVKTADVFSTLKNYKNVDIIYAGTIDGDVYLSFGKDGLKFKADDLKKSSDGSYYSITIKGITYRLTVQETKYQESTQTYTTTYEKNFVSVGEGGIKGEDFISESEIDKVIDDYNDMKSELSEAEKNKSEADSLRDSL